MVCSKIIYFVTKFDKISIIISIFYQSIKILINFLHLDNFLYTNYRVYYTRITVYNFVLFLFSPPHYYGFVTERCEYRRSRNQRKLIFIKSYALIFSSSSLLLTKYFCSYFCTVWESDDARTAPPRTTRSYISDILRKSKYKRHFFVFFICTTLFRFVSFI